MNTFQRKALSSAVLAGFGMAAGAAHAVYLDPNGLGQALVFPYYTVQQQGGNAYDTYISVVNTTTRAKALKVRFREGKNSREVLDFNLYMSANDVWAAVVTRSTDGARLVTGDTSCTFPAIPAGGVEFRNYAYAVGTNNDSAGTGLDRTREGYLEIVEMSTFVPGSVLEEAVTHVAGVPDDCSLVQRNLAGNPDVLGAPNGGLAGAYTLINVNNGADMGGNASAFANLTRTEIFTDVGDETSNLNRADPPTAVVVAQTPQGTTIYQANFSALRPVDAVSATIMHQSVINEYVLDSATRSNTDWVMTFPTKRFYVTAGATGTAITPFSNKFTASGSCEGISFSFFNREEAGGTAATGDFSPVLQGDALCWESTVLSIRNGASHMPSTSASGVLGSLNAQSVSVRTGFQNGWARLSFTGTNAVGTGLPSLSGSATNVTTGAASAVAPVFRGLPVVGFMVRTLFNGTLQCTSLLGGASSACQGSYGSLFEHRYEPNITPAP